MQRSFVRRIYLSTLAIITTFACGIGLAHQGIWGTHQYRHGYDYSYVAGTYQYYHLYVRDWDAEWPATESPYSSNFSARAWTYSSAAGYTYIYFCNGADLKAAGVNRIPDNSGAIGPNKDFVYTFIAPACYGSPGINYPETTVTIHCSADESFHWSSSGASKYSYTDGSKAFFSNDTEQVRANFNQTIYDYTCSINFENELGSFGSENAFVHAYDQRMKEK